MSVYPQVGFICYSRHVFSGEKNLRIYRERSVKASKVLRKCKCCSFLSRSHSLSLFTQEERPDRAQNPLTLMCVENAARHTDQCGFFKNGRFTARGICTTCLCNYTPSLALLLRSGFLLRGRTRAGVILTLIV